MRMFFARSICTVAVVGLAGFMLPSPAAADWPERAIRIVVPFAPGGNTDVQARLAAEVLSQDLGVSVVVENRPGAAGVIAAESVARADPDGYTLFMATISQVSIAPFTHEISYDPIEDFAPISIVGANPFVITVHESVPAETLEEFIDYANANPGTLSYGSGGIGGLTHLSAALFVDAAGIDIEHIPYAGGAPALNDLLGGTVQMYSGSPSELLPHKDSGRVRFLAVSSEQESSFFPGVPPIADVFPGHSALTWNGLVAPSGTPEVAIERISSAIQGALTNPDFQQRLAEIGVEPVIHTPEEFGEQIRADMDRWGPIIERLNLQ